MGRMLLKRYELSGWPGPWKNVLTPSHDLTYHQRGYFNASVS